MILAAILGSLQQATAFVLVSQFGNVGSGNLAVSWAGARLGDLAVVITNNDLTSDLTPPAGWVTAATYNPPSPAVHEGLYYKQLTAADIVAGSATWTGASFNTSAILAVYRGPTKAARKSNDSQTTTGTVFLAGFTKAVTCKAVVSATFARVTTDRPATPATFTSRVNSRGLGNFATALADITTPALYADGASVTWTGFTGDPSSGHTGWLIELT